MRGTMTVAKIWIPYCGAAPAPAELLARWNLDPLLIAAIALGAVAYRRYAQDSRRNSIAFAGLIATLLALFISPFCALSSALFSARVTHHVLLAVLAAPLLVAALPTFRPRLPLAFWTAAQTLIFWLWHAPGIYAWALSSDAAYWLMQLSLLASAALFWSSVRAASAPAAVAAREGGEALRLIAFGHTNAEIGQQLVLSVRTVEGHIYRMFGKLQISNREDLTAEHLD